MSLLPSAQDVTVEHSITRHKLLFRVKTFLTTESTQRQYFLLFEANLRVCLKKSPFYFFNNSGQNTSDFDDFWYTASLRNLTPEG